MTEDKRIEVFQYMSFFNTIFVEAYFLWETVLSCVFSPINPFIFSKTLC